MKKIIFLLFLMLIPNTSWAFFFNWPTCEQIYFDAPCDVYNNESSQIVANLVGWPVGVGTAFVLSAPMVPVMWLEVGIHEVTDGWYPPVLMALPWGIGIYTGITSGVVAGAPIYIVDRILLSEAKEEKREHQEELFCEHSV